MYEHCRHVVDVLQRHRFRRAQEFVLRDLVKPGVSQYHGHRAGTQRGHVARANASSCGTHSAWVSELHDTRGAVLLCDFCPLLPFVQDIWLEASLVCADITSDGEKPPVHLDLASDEQTIARSGPCGVEVLESINGRVEVGALCQSLLHGAFDKAVRESEAAW